MSTTDYRVTALLTEHFGFPPLALIDDVINAVNDIMYKCTEAIETYLMDRQQKVLEELKNLENNDNGVLVDKQASRPSYPTEEIQIGTGKLETLLESQVDKNFDKFELYALRNIFTLPHELVEEGWIKLKHHEGIEFDKESAEKKEGLDRQISELIKRIKFELHLRKILKLQILKAQKLINVLRLFQDNLSFLSSKEAHSTLSDEGKLALKSLSPIDESLYFLLNQVDDLIRQTQKIHNKVSNTTDNNGIEDIKFLPNLRDKYTDGVSLKILERIGILENESLENSDTLKSFDNLTSISDIEVVKNINQGLNKSESSSIQPPHGQTNQSNHTTEELSISMEGS